MQSSTILNLVTEDTQQILASIKDKTLLAKIVWMKNKLSKGKFDVIKKAINLLACLCDFRNETIKSTESKGQSSILGAGNTKTTANKTDAGNQMICNKAIKKEQSSKT